MTTKIVDPFHFFAVTEDEVDQILARELAKNPNLNWGVCPKKDGSGYVVWFASKPQGNNQQ